MKIAFMVIAILVFAGFAFGADVFVAEIEPGSRLPDPWGCLSYQGRSDRALGLKAVGCTGKEDDWIIVPKSSPSAKYPNGFYATQFSAKILIFEPLKFNRVKFYYRRFDDETK